MLRALLKALQSLGLILVHADAVCIAIAQVRQGWHVLPGSCLGIQQYRLLRVRLHADTGLQAPAQIGQAQRVIHGRRPLVAGQGIRLPFLIHGVVAQCHPVARGQFLLIQRVKKGTAAAGADIRLLLGHKAAVRVFTTIVIHSNLSYQSSGPPSRGEAAPL